MLDRQILQRYVEVGTGRLLYKEWYKERYGWPVPSGDIHMGNYPEAIFRVTVQSVSDNVDNPDLIVRTVYVSPRLQEAEIG